MKKFVYLAMFLLILGMASADVVVIEFEYDNGDINILDSIIKPGNYPDRKLTSGSYRLVEISDEFEVLYSFRFDVPLEIYTDRLNEYGDIEGNVYVLNQTKFSLVVPYYDNLREVKVLDEQQDELSTHVFTPALSPNSPNFLAVVLVVIGIMFIMFSLLYYRIFHRKLYKR